LIITQSSIFHFISDSVNLFKNCALDDKRSQVYETSQKSSSISKALKGNFFINSLIASVNSYSHLSESSISFTSSSIFASNLYTHRLAKFPILFFGFSTISFIFWSTSTLIIQYFSGLSTFFTKTPYQSKVNIFSKSFCQKILSQLTITISVSDSTHLIAAHVPFSSFCSL